MRVDIDFDHKELSPITHRELEIALERNTAAIVKQLEEKYSRLQVEAEHGSSGVDADDEDEDEPMQQSKTISTNVNKSRGSKRVLSPKKMKGPVQERRKDVNDMHVRAAFHT